jgi:mono/diheme cytochrome c family protein
MKLCLPASLSIFALLIVSGCNRPANDNVNHPSTATPAATATPDEFAFARANYAKNCSNCHGQEGKGGVVTVDNVKLKVPSLTEGHALKHTDEDFADQIKKGGDGMPKFKDKLSPQEINDLVGFIRHEFQGRQ